MSRLLQAIEARISGAKLGLSHGNDADGIVCAALFLRRHPGGRIVLADPWEIKPTWKCWFNWLAWDFVADLPCPFRARLHVDHHRTGRPCAKQEFFNPGAPSAASMAIEALGLRGDRGAYRLVELANECDTASIKSKEAWDLNDAVKGSSLEDRVLLAKLLAAEGVEALSYPAVRRWVEVNRERRMRAFDLAGRVKVRDYVFVKLNVDDERFPVRAFMLSLEERGAKLTCIVAPRKGRFKIYLGSRYDSDIDCAELAMKVGGGGHFHAAGATVDNVDLALRRLGEALGISRIEVEELDYLRT
ncbi:MAG: DHHA1 domain-containing protein [Candidatus Nezhaarchaeota archaeon]|nr:DHHA1 domain-containing protein [Candidatus Nezhaarchaeota archaeon]